MKRIVSLVASAAAAASFGAACAPDVPETGYSLPFAQQAIRGGDVEEGRPYVVGIVIQQGQLGGACSGTLVAPNMVITAHHCVAEIANEGVDCNRSRFGDLYAASSFFITTETEFPRSAFGYHTVAEVYVPELTDEFCGTDIAVLILEDNIDASEAVPVIPKIDVTPRFGDRYTAVGYGETNSGVGDAGTRRVITGRQVVCAGEQCARFTDQVNEKEWVGGDGTCQGDSGGPAFDNDERVFDGCQGAVYTGLWGWSDWLRDLGLRAAELGDYTPPQWVTTGSSEPLPDGDDDGFPDEADNCVDEPNEDQEDADGDGLGDACDDRDDRDRGGVCDICNGCNDDGDCPGGTCVDFGDGGVCTFDCSDAACPDTTTCFNVEGQSLCLNNDAGTSVCPDTFVCGGARADLGDDDCSVCTVCATDEECGPGNSCVDLGGGPVCSTDCESNDDCDGDSVCFDVGDRSLCLNPDAGSAGVCPGNYICSVPDDIISADDGGAGEEGCASTRAPSAAWLGLGLVGLLVSRRRRAA
jgi:MYXO-CTERM domain-containing protein